MALPARAVSFAKVGGSPRLMIALAIPRPANGRGISNRCWVGDVKWFHLPLEARKVFTRQRFGDFRVCVQRLARGELPLEPAD